MDDDADHTVFQALGVGAIRAWATKVEADHGVFHACKIGVGRDGSWVRIIKGIPRIDLKGVDHCSGRIALPKWIPFLGIVRHGHHSTIAKGHALRIPDEFSRRTESKVTDIFCLKHPGLFLFAFAFFSFGGFLLSNDHQRSICFFRFLQTIHLGFGEDVFGILKLPSSTHHMIGRSSDGHFKIPKGEGELTTAQELFVLPTIHIVVGTHPRIELCNVVHVVVFLREILVARAATISSPIIDVVRPLDAKGHRFARLQGLWQVNAHHGFVDDKG